MSEWHQVTEIDIDPKQREFNLLIDCDEFGNVYATITYRQLSEMLNLITKNKESLNEPSH